MKRQAAVGFIIVIVIGAGMILWRRSMVPSDGGEQRYVAHTQSIMATPVTVIAPEPVAAEVAALVFDVFRDIDVTMSEWKPDSPLTAVNRAAGADAVAVPEDLRAVIRRGIELGDLTGGAFDITWAALWGVWDFKADPPALPDPGEIERRLALIDYSEVEIDDDAGTVRLPRAGMFIGLGGIAKGTALNRAVEALEARGFDSFLISSGGQVVVRGRRGERPWRVGIRDPRGGIDDHFADLDVMDTGVSTSGDYERFFILDGERYHHILDPRTGRPSRELRSATVVCADAELADALSTAMMIVGPAEARALADRMDGVEIVLVDEHGAVHVSDGLQAALLMRHEPVERIDPTTVDD